MAQTLNAEVMFNVNDSSALSRSVIVDKAIVAFEHPVEANWPLDAINEALRISYQASMDPPQIYPVFHDRVCVGFVTRPRNDLLDRDDLNQFFWQTMLGNDVARQTSDGYEFVMSTPINTSALWDGVMVGVVGFVVNFGPLLPVECINHAFRTIMGQGEWGTTGADVLYIYSVFRHTSGQLSGLYLDGAIDGFGENPEEDDNAFIAVRNCTTKQTRQQYPNFAPWRP